MFVLYKLWFPDIFFSYVLVPDPSSLFPSMNIMTNFKIVFLYIYPARIKYFLYVHVEKSMGSWGNTNTKSSCMVFQLCRSEIVSNIRIDCQDTSGAYFSQ